MDNSPEIQKQLEILEQQYQQLAATTAKIGDLEIIQAQINTIQNHQKEQAILNSSVQLETVKEMLEQERQLTLKTFQETLNNQWNEMVDLLQTRVQPGTIKEMLEQERQLTEAWVAEFVRTQQMQQPVGQQEIPTPSSEHLNDLRTMIELLYDLCRTSMTSSRFVSSRPAHKFFQRTSAAEHRAQINRKGQNEKSNWQQAVEEQQQHSTVVSSLLSKMKDAALTNMAVDDFWTLLTEDEKSLIVRAFTDDPDLMIFQSDISLTTQGRTWLASLHSYVTLIETTREETKNEQPF